MEENSPFFEITKNVWINNDRTELQVIIDGKCLKFFRSDVANQKVFEQMQNKFYGEINNQQRQMPGSGGCSGCP